MASPAVKIRLGVGLAETWRPGADGARFLLNTFIQSTLGDYQDARDYPAETGTTRLSAHLHFGEISPRQVWHAVRDAAARATDIKIENDSWNIIRQLCWRDFNHDLLSRHPDMATRNIDTRFDDFPWQSEHDALRRWQQGDTGYPIVDAGMREALDHRMDAQPGSDDCRLIPREASAHPLAIR